jgi:hypothetical protein
MDKQEYRYHTEFPMYINGLQDDNSNHYYGCLMCPYSANEQGYELKGYIWKTNIIFHIDG